MKKGVFAFVAAIWLAFSGVGLLMHRACENAPKNHLGWTSIAGYDSEGYVTHFTCPVGIMEINHRHPLMVAVTAPVTAVGMMVSFRVGQEIGNKAVICCFALIGALTCWLLWAVMKRTGSALSSRIAAMLLWLSFAHVWILGGVAELFGISMMILLGVILMTLYGVRDSRVWFGASLLAGGVTVTNFIKPLAAWMVAADGFRSMRRIRMRTVVLFVALVAGGLGVASLAVMCKWMFLDGISVKQGVSITVNEVAKFLSTDFSLSERLRLAWNAFWCEPMMLRESVIGQGEIVHDYRTFLPHILGAAVLALCVWSAIRNRRLPVVRAALSMVVFDFLLHVVVGWGIDEGQIYCGHWFWAIPLLVVLLPRRVVPVVLALAIGIAAQNLAVVFS